jgi:uncharacterized protein YndB with AHSA1/START domain
MRQLVPMLTLAGLAAFSSPALAEVVNKADDGFVVRHIITVKAQPLEAWRGLGQINQWWNKAHTYSGNAANLSLVLRAGGCFCEVLPTDHGTVEHGRVLLAWPGKTLRLSAALGPLQQEAVSAVLSWDIAPAATGSTITMTYRVGGRMTGGLAPLAAPVNSVMTEQAERLKVWLDQSALK